MSQAALTAITFFDLYPGYITGPWPLRHMGNASGVARLWRDQGERAEARELLAPPWAGSRLPGDWDEAACARSGKAAPGDLSASRLTAGGSPILTAIRFTVPLEDRNDLDKGGRLYEPL